MDLKFLPQAFAATRLAQPETLKLALTPSLPAAFFNYDVSYTHGSGSSAGTTRDLGVLGEFGFSSNWGVLTSTYVGRNLTSNDPAAPGGFRRLETTFTRDMPERNLSLRLGDSTTRTGIWGRPVYFGGIQVSRNFALTPGFISQPIPVLTGLSSAPSTVELYVNDALRQTSQVPAGPFAIDNFPLLTGSGRARVVVRDVLGRETVLEQNFFSSAELLEEGLSDWSAELGAVRRNLGTDSGDYGQRFASGLYRYGFNKRFTAEGRAEAGADTQGAGFGLTAALPFQLLGQAAFAVSNNKTAGRGGLWLAGIEHNSLRHGFTVRVEGASQNYRYVGQDTLASVSKRQYSASYSYLSERFGNIGLGFARIDTYDRGSITTYSLNYSVRVFERSSLTFNAVHVNGATSGNLVGVNLTIPLEGNITTSSNVSIRDGRLDAYTGATKGLGAETGTGWRTLAGVRQKEAYAEGGVYYQGGRGLLTADLNASKSLQTLRLGAQGGLVMADGQFFVSRRVDDAFALVEVPGYADVGVGFQGSVLTRTNAAGKALVPRLIAYQPNSIRLDPSQLPISAELDSIEQVVVPGSRSAVRVAFPVRSGRGALVRIVLDDGEPAPAGAELELVGDKQEFFVARRGEAFITGLQATNTVRLRHNSQTCTFNLALPPGSLDEIARIGPLVCAGVKR